MQNQLHDSHRVIEQSQACNDELKQRLQDCKNVLRGNEQMIRWLNTQVWESLQPTTSGSRKMLHARADCWCAQVTQVQMADAVLQG